MNDHDFPGELGKVAPYGVYDLTASTGWVNVGTDRDTAQFAVESIRRWWNTVGRHGYPSARRLLITADAGGSNGSRLRLRKTELATLADETGLEITVLHFPPGTSKWNKVEHRLFSAITTNWRGRPLTSHEVDIETIAATTTSTGLKVRAVLDTNTYQKGIKNSGKEMKEFEARHLHRHDFHGNWNYTIRHRRRSPDTPGQHDLIIARLLTSGRRRSHPTHTVTGASPAQHPSTVLMPSLCPRSTSAWAVVMPVPV